jgi:hypothetical protein
MPQQRDFAIEIKRSGQHPFSPGAARFSTWVAILAWVFFAIVFTQQAIPMTGRNIIAALVVTSLGIGALWGGGVLLARKNPFFQEILLRYLARSIRNRTDLET